MVEYEKRISSAAGKRKHEKRSRMRVELVGKRGGRFWNGFWEVQCVVVGNLKPVWSETGDDFIDEKHQRCGRSWGLELAGGSVACDLKYFLSKSFNNISHLSNFPLCTRKTNITKKSS